MRDMLTFGEATLAVTDDGFQSIEADSRFPTEGKLTRCFIKYRNGDSNIVCPDVDEDETLYWPVWVPEMCCCKTLEDAEAERIE